MNVEQQKPLPVIYEQVKLDCGYRIDLLVEGSVVVEVKSVDALAPIHEAQVLTYLKLSGCKLGLLINFNVQLLKDGIVVSLIAQYKTFTTEVTESTDNTQGKPLRVTKSRNLNPRQAQQNFFSLCSLCPLW